jgi:hypothetical protein
MKDWLGRAQATNKELGPTKAALSDLERAGAPHCTNPDVFVWRQRWNKTTGCIACGLN